MDEITQARLKKLQKSISDLESVNSSLASFFFTCGSDQESADIQFNKYIEGVILMDDSVQGSFFLEEAEAILDVHRDFQSFFQVMKQEEKVSEHKATLYSAIIEKLVEIQKIELNGVTVYPVGETVFRPSAYIDFGHQKGGGSRTFIGKERGATANKNAPAL